MVYNSTPLVAKLVTTIEQPELNNQNWTTRTHHWKWKTNAFDDESKDEDNENDDSNQQNIPDQTDDEIYNGFITQYGNDDHQQTLAIPFGILKKDEPFATTKYILTEIIGTQSNNQYHLRAKKVISQTSSNNQKTGMLLQHWPHHLHQLYKEQTLT